MMTAASRRERNHSTQLPVEALVGAVLPRFSGIDQRDLDVRLDDPLEDRAADELRAVVRTQERGCAALANQPRQCFDDALGTDAAGDVDRQAFAGELVDDRQALELLAVGAGIEDEIIGPDAVRCERGQRSWP